MTNTPKERSMPGSPSLRTIPQETDFRRESPTTDDELLAPSPPCPALYHVVARQLHVLLPRPLCSQVETSPEFLRSEPIHFHAASTDRPAALRSRSGEYLFDRTEVEL